MKILYFASVDFYQKPNPSFHLMTTMLSDLLNAGFQIEFVGCAIEGVDKHIPEELANHERFKYKLINIPNTPKSSFAQRYIDGIKYAIKAKKWIKEIIRNCDCVFIQSSPTVMYNINAIRALDNRIPIIYNIQDMFPGSSIASGVMPWKSMQRVFYKLQKIAYKKSNVITVISEDMKSKLMEQGVPEEKIKVIVNWFDDRKVQEVQWANNRFVKKYNLSEDLFYVQYAGTFGYVFDYQMVLKVAELLKDTNEIVFHMIGEGSQKNKFIEEAKQRNLSNIVFLPLEPQEMVSDVYSAGSVCFIPLKKGIIGNSVPSKAGLLMACKRPIVSTSDQGSCYNEMINQNKIGFAFGTDQAEQVANSLLYLYRNRNECINRGINGFEYGKHLYSRTSNMKKYIELFSQMQNR